MARESIQRSVETRVGNSFFLQEALLEGIVNLRAAAKMIRPDIRQGSVEAIAVALRRYAEKTAKRTGQADRELAALLSKTSMRVRTSIADFTLVSGSGTFSKVSEVVKKINPGKGGLLHVVFGQDATTMVVDMDNYGLVKKAMGGQIIEERKNLAEVSIVTPKRVENAVGWVALISRLLARNGINMIETLSCYTETILIVEEADLGRTIETMRKVKNG